MLCRVEMPANEQIFGRFYRYRMLHGQGGGRTSSILMPVVLVLLLALTLIIGISPLLVGGMAVLMLGFYAYSLYMRPSQIFRQKEAAALNTEVTIFTDSGFTRTVKNEEGGMADTASGNYASLVKAVETGSDFFLYTSPTQAYLIDKAYFTNGTPEELRAVLAKNLGAKFKGKKG